MMRIGLYGGSFDPLHFGHINFAVEMLEKHNLDEVWFVLAKKNPHKSGFFADELDRLHMLKMALGSIKNFVVRDDELQRPAPSYTIDTVESLQSTYSESKQFFLLLGKDVLQNFHKWHRAKDLASIIPILIGERPSCQKIVDKDDQDFFGFLNKNITPIRMLDINSTQIRERISKGLYCGHLVPEKVLDYIYNNKLYCSFNF